MNEELKVIISAEISKLQQNVEKAKSHVKGFQEQVKKASENVDKNFAAIGSAMANGAKAAATGLVAADAALLALGASTQEYRNEQAKLTTAFETAGASAGQAKETYNDLYRVLGDSGVAVEAANHLAKLTTEEKALSEWTNICQGVYATFGDSLPIEGLTEAVNHTAQLGEVQGPLADALEWSGITTDEYNEQLAECSSIEEREKLIRETLNGLYSEAASNYEKNNKAVLEQNEAQARLQETTAALGEAVAPVVTAFTQFANEALAVVVPYIQQLAEQYGPQLKDMLSQIAESLGVAFGWVVQHKEILAVMAGIIAGIAAAIGLYNAVAAVKAAMAALEVTTVWGLVSAYAAQAAAMVVAIAPYLAIVAAIAAVIAIIVLCVKHWDKIKEVTKKVWDSIKQWTEQAVAKVVAKFTEMKEKAAQIFNLILQVASQIFENIANSIKSKIELAKTIVQNTIALIKAIFTGDLGAAKTAVANIFTALTDSIKSKLEKAKSTVKSIISAIVGFFTGAKFSWPKISMPKFSITPSGWKIGDLLKGSIPKLSIKWNALGGVFDKPTLFGYGNSLQGIGENGAEAVVPLEKNLEWLDKLAAMLNDRMGGNTPIVLNVDGKVFAQTAISTINQQTRQTGKLALNLV